MFLTKIGNDNNKSNGYDLVATLQFDELRIATFETITTGRYNNPEIEANDGRLDISSQYSEDEKGFWDYLGYVGGRTLGGAAAGAVVGAAIGSVIPVVGTAAGALIGAAVGAVYQCISSILDWTG